jgi:hypothetical protein
MERHVVIDAMQHTLYEVACYSLLMLLDGLCEVRGLYAPR